MNDLKERFEQETRGLRVATDGLERTFRRIQRRSRNRRIGSAVVVLALAAVGIGALVRPFYSSTVPANDPAKSLFPGTWVSLDTAGLDNAQTMVISARGEAVEIVVSDESASVCSHTPSTMTGTGRLDGPSRLVIPTPTLTCDDGSEPDTQGPPLEDQLRNMTFVYSSSTDALTDNLGLRWTRTEGDTRPGTETSGGMWPQLSLEEVRDAQERADAGDPDFTWQVDPHLYALTTPRAAPGGPYGAEIFSRFLQEELGWQSFRGAPFAGSGSTEGHHEGIAFVRCAPGRTNPMYSNDPAGRGCAPSIDELRYETVQIEVDQLAGRGPSGIWVVTRWAILPRSLGPITPTSDLYGKQIEQVVPPTDAEVAGLLDAFLQARVDHLEVQEYLHSKYTPVDEIPLLYATTSGAAYERFEIERVEGPVWPIGYLNVELRLFAEGGNTVVEQAFSLYREVNGRLGLEYGGTTENGKVVVAPSSILDGQVTFLAPRPPWDEWSTPELGYLIERSAAGGAFKGAIVSILPNSLSPQRPCDATGGVPPSAEALIRAIQSDPDLETTPPVSDRVAGIDARRLDVTAAPGAAPCYGKGVWVAPSPYGNRYGRIRPDERGRLYILDLPEGIRVQPESGPAGSVRTLTILITAPEKNFDRAVETAAPILDSIEFHPD